MIKRYSNKLFKYSEAIDLLIHDIFLHDTNYSNDDRYKLYISLLNRTNFCSPNNFENIKFYKEKFNETCEINSEISDNFSNTYTVASYWSPLNNKRRSIVHWPILKGIENNERQKKAVAFFSLSLKGKEVKRGIDKRWALVQFLLEADVKKRVVISSFCETEIQNKEYLFFPKWIQNDFLAKLGIDKNINKFLEIETNELAVILDYLLKGDIDDNKINKIVNEFTTTTISTFNNKLKHLPNKYLEFIEENRRLLNSTFFQTNTKNKITFNQTAFMLMTHLLWNEACPSKHTHAFPIKVSNTCCVLTFGSDNLLNQEELLFIFKYAHSLFNPAIIRDYYEKDKKSYQELRNVYNGMRAFIDSAKHSLDKSTDYLDYALDKELNNLDSSYQPIIDRMKDEIRNIFDIHERLTFFSEAGFVEKLKDIIEECNLFNIIKKVISDDLLTLKINKYNFDIIINKVDLQNTKVTGHSIAIYEILKTIIDNAANAIIERYLKTKYNDRKIIIDIVLSTYENDIINIFISDNGIGLTQKQKDQMVHSTPNSNWHNIGVKSSGTGFYRANMLAKCYGIMIYVSNKPKTNMATTIKLEFPRSEIAVQRNLQKILQD